MILTGLLSRTASIIDEIPGVYIPQDDLENTVANLGAVTVMSAAALLVVLTIVAILFSEKFPRLKLPLFVMMAIAMAGSTLVLIGSTIYLNTSSESGGPIHWHADAEFWVCGNEIELRDPTAALSNKIGTSVLHEHDDHRIHLEGVAVEKKVNASLGKFMHVVGGAITEDALVMPVNGEGTIFEDEEDGDGPAETDASLVDPYVLEDADLGKVLYVRDGDTCGDIEADVQVFVYNYDGDTKTYKQTKLDNPRDYVITEDPNVPPGDCIIFEFGPERDQTDKLCEQYGIRDIERCEQFGVEPDQREICELTQVDYNPESALEEESPVNTYTIDEEALTAEDVYSDANETPLESHPCALYFDSEGNPTNVDLVILDDEGNPINPETDCVDYLELVEQQNATEAEAN